MNVEEGVWDLTRSMSAFNASGSMTGYLYQARHALHLALEYAYEQTDVSISIEQFDDVAFVKFGDPKEVLQIKHHLNRASSLSDMSMDLWKTIGIWVAGLDEDEMIGIEKRVLITTSIAADESACKKLGVVSRDVGEAVQLLIKAAGRSKNRETETQRRAFLQMEEGVRQALLETVFVLDGAANIIEINELTTAKIKMAVPAGRSKAFMERLEGWWFKVVIEALVHPIEAVSIVEIENQIDAIRESLAVRDALPLDFEDAFPDASTVVAYDQRNFVQKVRMVGLGENRIGWPKSFYYRASEQRSRWIREHLLFTPDLDDYEELLQQEWSIRFESMLDDLPPDAPENIKQQLGRKFYEWFEQSADIPLRKTASLSLCRGSFHILADLDRINWHPDSDAQRIEDGGG